MGTLNTSGIGCVKPDGFPSAPAIVTVGRVAIVEIVDGHVVVVDFGQDIPHTFRHCGSRRR